MFKIGEFSRLSRISIRMLRHYDEMNLLKPMEVDAFTGYRYYSGEQLIPAGQIQSLKAMGFPLNEIREIMRRCKGHEEMESFLSVRKKEMELRLADTQKQMLLIDSMLEWLRKDGDMMEYNVTLKTLPERYVASVRQVIPAFHEEGRLWEILNRETKSMGLQYANPGYGLAVYHDEGFKEQDVDVEIQIAVTGEYPDTEHVKFKRVPAVQYASATFKGPYDKITTMNVAVANWITSNGFAFDGAAFCIYHVGPNDTTKPEEWVTEVCFPVKKK